MQQGFPAGRSMAVGDEVLRAVSYKQQEACCRVFGLIFLSLRLFFLNSFSQFGEEVDSTFLFEVSITVLSGLLHWAVVH